jgi:hypothetical protein
MSLTRNWTRMTAKLIRLTKNFTSQNGLFLGPTVLSGHRERIAR